MKSMAGIFLSVFVLMWISVANALEGKFEPDTRYLVCFTPGENCTQQIEKLIGQAKQEILVQGYSFTSEPIAQALTAAKERGVTVKVILDKSQKTQRYTLLPYLIEQGISVWIDYKPSIAHNKIIIVDESIVKTGSFNYSKGANARNAENVIIIQDKQLALRYKQNWEKRRGHSLTVKEYDNLKFINRKY